MENNNENLNNQVDNGALNSKGNKKINIVIIVIVVVIALIAFGKGVYDGFTEEPNKPKDNNTQEENNETITNISVVKSDESWFFNVILDTNGNAYLGIKDKSDIEDNDTLVNLFKNAKTYSYNDKNESLIKVDLQNIKDIQCINYGNGGGKYITFLDQSDKLYVLIDFIVMDTGSLTPLTDEKVNKVTKVYPECDVDGCMVYANAVVNDKEEKISLYDLFEKED